MKSYKKKKTARKMAGKAKTDQRYWMEGQRLFKDRSPDYSCRITFQKQRVRFPLKTPNKKEAAKKAAKIYSFVAANGWEVALKTLKSNNPDGTTVGEVIATARRYSTARENSFDTYAKALRKIVSEIENLPPLKKHDTINGGTNQWREKVDAIPIASITPERVIRWKNQRIANLQPDKRGKGTVTVNSLIRNSKALFAKKFISFMRSAIDLPEKLPFDGVTLDKPPSQRYHSRINASELVELAFKELSRADEETFKVFLLAMMCGLRKSEIDNLLWSSFDFRNKILRIEDNQYHQLKSEDSAGDIDLEDSTAKLFEAFSAESDSKFVINSAFRPMGARKLGSYRCEGVFNRLNKWLRKNGVDASKPTHTLRKEIGSVIAAQYGIFEASRFLRHSDIRITAAVYADKKQRVVPRL